MTLSVDWFLKERPQYIPRATITDSALMTFPMQVDLQIVAIEESGVYHLKMIDAMQYILGEFGQTRLKATKEQLETIFGLPNNFEYDDVLSTTVQWFIQEITKNRYGTYVYKIRLLVSSAFELVIKEVEHEVLAMGTDHSLGLLTDEEVELIFNPIIT